MIGTIVVHGKIECGGQNGDKDFLPIRHLCFKGAVVYSAGSFVKKIWKKESGSWQEINYTKVYKKVNGVWVEQSDVSTAFESGVNYVWG